MNNASKYQLVPAHMEDLHELLACKQIGRPEKHFDDQDLRDYLSKYKNPYDSDIITSVMKWEEKNQNGTSLRSFVVLEFDDDKHTIAITQMGSRNSEDNLKNLPEIFAKLADKYETESISIAVPEADKALLDGLKNLDGSGISIEFGSYHKGGKEFVTAYSIPQQVEGMGKTKIKSLSNKQKMIACLERLKDVTQKEWGVGEIRWEGDSNNICIEPIDLNDPSVGKLLAKKGFFNKGRYDFYTLAKMKHKAYSTETIEELFSIDHKSSFPFANHQSGQVMIFADDANTNAILQTTYMPGQLAEHFVPTDSKSQFHPERYWQDMNSEQVMQHETRNRDRISALRANAEKNNRGRN